MNYIVKFQFKSSFSPVQIVNTFFHLILLNFCTQFFLQWNLQILSSMLKFYLLYKIPQVSNFWYHLINKNKQMLSSLKTEKNVTINCLKYRLLIWQKLSRWMYLKCDGLLIGEIVVCFETKYIIAWKSLKLKLRLLSWVNILNENKCQNIYMTVTQIM